MITLKHSRYCLLIACAFLLSSSGSVRAELRSSEGEVLKGDAQVEQEIAQRILNLSQAQALLASSGEEAAAERLEERIEHLQEELAHLRDHHRQSHPRPQADLVARIAQMCEQLTQQQQALIEEVRISREEIAQLRQSLDEFRAIIEERHRAEHAERMSHVDLTGEWSMTLPSGSTSQVVLVRQDDDLLQFKSPTVLSGLYEHNGSQLTVLIPNDERLTEFVWSIRDPNTLLLTESSTDTGADYTGALLKRIK